MFGAPSSLLSDSEVQALRVSTLASSAYVALCLGDYSPALEYAETLLREPRVPGAHRTLAHLYAAEALLLLDRVNEAIEHLNPDHVIDLDIALPPPGVDAPQYNAHGKRGPYSTRKYFFVLDSVMARDGRRFDSEFFSYSVPPVHKGVGSMCSQIADSLTQSNFTN